MTEAFMLCLNLRNLLVYLKKIGKQIPVGTRVTLYDELGFFALAEVREFEGGTAIKPIKQFDV